MQFGMIPYMDPGHIPAVSYIDAKPGDLVLVDFSGEEDSYIFDEDEPKYPILFHTDGRVAKIESLGEVSRLLEKEKTDDRIVREDEIVARAVQEGQLGGYESVFGAEYVNGELFYQLTRSVTGGLNKNDDGTGLAVGIDYSKEAVRIDFLRRKYARGDDTRFADIHIKGMWSLDEGSGYDFGLRCSRHKTTYKMYPPNFHTDEPTWAPDHFIFRQKDYPEFAVGEEAIMEVFERWGLEHIARHLGIDPRG